MDNNTYIERKEYNKERDKILDKLEQHEREIATMQAFYTSFKDLPQTIANLDKNMALMEQNLKALNEKIDTSIIENKNQDDAQNKRIKEIDNKSKIDFLAWIKEHWISVFALGSVLAMYLQQAIK